MKKFYIFRCSDETYKECINKKLFGQTKVYLDLINQINPGDIVFLHKVFQYKSQNVFIEGPFFADKAGENLDSEAWNGKFPAQLKVEKRGTTKKISKETILNSGLFFDKDGIFFDFRIPDAIGWKLLEALGYSFEFEKEEIKEVIPPTKEEFNYRLKYPTDYRCNDGHYVRSRGEALVDNYLFEKGIAHAYEKKIPGENMISDFYIRNKRGEEIYLEIWGLEDSAYLERKNEKIKIYTSRNLKLIQIEPKHIKNLDDYLSDELVKYNIE